MSTEPATLNPYDEVPYPSHALSGSNPDRLAAAGRLFGMWPQAVERCRVLELGCSTGGNLAPMADRHPESTFVGLDYSERQISIGRREIDAAGLTNIELRQADIREVDERLGTFDYIICHGVFSWVDTELQEKVLAICKSRLNPQGIVYISYNVYPGWHLRTIFRDLMRACTPESTPRRQRATQGRKLLEFFSTAMAGEKTPWGRLFKREVDLVLPQSDAYLCHEYLETDNYPLYAYEFSDRMARHGLQYLGSAPTVAEMFADNYPPAIARQLRQLSSDQVAMEQHLDLLRFRSHRLSLLCHDNIKLSRSLSPESVKDLYFAAQYKPENPNLDLTSRAADKFNGPRGTVITTAVPAVKASLCQLGEIWPLATSIAELADTAEARLAAAGSREPFTAEDRTAVAANLIQCLMAGAIEIFSTRDDFVTEISQFPRASRLARNEALVGRNVTNRRHMWISLDDASQKVLQYLDGQHDRPGLQRALVEAVGRGETAILVGGVPASRGEVVAQSIDAALDRSLPHLAANAMLIT